MARGEIPDDELAPLYAGPLEDFIAERDSLAKRLRSDGKRDLADQVHGLKKPSAAAWAVNQAVRAKPKAAKRLVEAGEKLASAQTSALKGAGSAALKDAMSDHSAAVEEMTDAVREVAGGEDGLSSAMLDRATETLRAVATDAELREEFEGGRVTQDRKASGFGGPMPSASPRPASGRKGPTAAQRRQAKRRVNAAERKLGTAERKVGEARDKVERAEEDLEAARDALERAESERAERESELEDASAALAEHED